MRYLCVFAHQDDEMRCLGTLLRLHADGHSIAFVCISAGDKGLPFTPTSSMDDAAAVRNGEMLSVAAYFGGEYRCLGREDGFVAEDMQLRRELIKTLRELRPDVVLTHWTSDYNSDHVVTAKAVTDAALFTSLPSFEPATPAIAAAPRIFHVNPGEGYGFEATHFVELDEDLLTVKQGLIRLHESQMAVMRSMRGHDYADEMTVEDRRQGTRLMVAAAESFRPCLAERRVGWPSDLPGRLG